MTGRVGTVRCEFCLPRHEIRLGSADVADLKRIHNFWAKLVFCCMELLKYCRNVANVKTFGIMKLFQKNRHPHLRLKHRRADAEHIRPATNPTQVSFRKDWLISYEEVFIKTLSMGIVLCILTACTGRPSPSTYSNSSATSSDSNVEADNKNTEPTATGFKILRAPTILFWVVAERAAIMKHVLETTGPPMSPTLTIHRKRNIFM